MKKLVIVVLCLFWAGLSRADLAKTIDGIISQSSEKDVKFSIQIVRADSGQVVYGHNADTPMIPASNMKIVTTAAALKYLGPEFEYKTRIGLIGDSLAVTGSGDPLFGFTDIDSKEGREPNIIFQNIIAALKQKSVISINDIITDTSIFDDQRVHPNWPADQLNREYACEISGLNFHGNCVYITVKNAGKAAVISIEPQTGYVEIINEVKTEGKGKDAVGAYPQKGKPNTFLVSGTCRKIEGPFGVTIERPAAFFGFVLAENLRRAGISVRGKILERPLDSGSKIIPLAEFRTPLAECLARCNKNSFSLAAESLFKTMAACSQPSGKNGGWLTEQQAIRSYLATIGANEQEFSIDDGSGLSRQNRLSANTITKILLSIYKSNNWNFYKNSLAVAGQDGTIAKYFKEKKYKGKIFGKTGYLAGVKALSGVCATGKGEYIFSILTNNANGKTRDAINDIAKAIIDNQ